MKKHGLNRLMTAAVITSVTLMTAACNKASAQIDTLPMVTETPVDNSDESSRETSPDVETESATRKSGTAGTDTAGEVVSGNETDSAKATEPGTNATDSTESPAETDTAETTITIESTKPAETETSKQTVTDTSSEKVTETATQAPTEKATEKQTEKPTEAPTQKPAENTTAPTEKATQAHTHSYTATVPKQPTCTATGTRTYKCSCGDSYTEAIPATGHSFGAYTYNGDATEAADGTETAACTICGAKDTRTAAGTKIAHVHNYTAVVTKAATCAEEGVKTYTCSCGSSYTEPIPVIAHSFGDYVYNNDATTEKDGTKTATCSVCGRTDTVTAEGTKKTLPSWYDEHSQTLNVTTGAQDDGSLEAYYVSGQFDWTGASEGCNFFGYSNPSQIIGRFAEGVVVHGWLE